MTSFMATEREEWGTWTEGGGRFVMRGEIIRPFNATHPFFVKKIKLPDLIKLSDVFVKLKKVFDVWWKEIEISSESVILECLPQVQLSCSKWLVMIKAAEPIQKFDWATDTAGTINVLVWRDKELCIKSGCSWYVVLMLSVLKINYYQI